MPDGGWQMPHGTDQPRFPDARKWVALSDRKCGMRNSEWGMGKEKWQMTNGGWRMANDATERPNQVSLVPESGWPLPQPWRRAPPAGREWSTVGWRRAGRKV